MKYTVLDKQTVRPKHTPGVNWLSERLVLVRMGDKELWWWKARAENRYHRQPGELMLANKAGTENHNQRTVTLNKDGGRLTKKLLTQHSMTIEAFFDSPGLAEHLHPRKTVVITNECD